MGIGKTKTSQVDLDGLMTGIGTAPQANEKTAANDKQLEDLRAVQQSLQDDRRLEELRAAQQSLQTATAALNAATDRTDIIIKGLNKAIEDIPTMSIGAQVDPDTLKTLSAICDKFALDVARQLMSHRDKQLEQQNAHEQRLYNILRKSHGLWISHAWLKALTIIFIFYTLLVILYVKFG